MGQLERAKALTPIRGKTLLDIILDKIGDLFEEIVIVSSPRHEKDFLDHLKTRKESPKSRVVVQERPLGSLNAVNIGSKVVDGDCIVVWGDQIGVSRSTLEFVIRNKQLGYSLMVPTLLTDGPYVWLNYSDNLDHILSIGRKRDGDSIEKGWSDLGVFYFSVDALMSLRLLESELVNSLGDREVDLTYALPVLSKNFKSHFPIRTNTSELLSVNDPEDLHRAQEDLP